MRIALKKWSMEDREDLKRISNAADRRYLSDRLPFPYTDEDADWWLAMVSGQEGSGGVFRAIIADGKIAGNISVERKTDVYRCDAEIGYLLAPEFESKGIMTEAVRQICGIAFEEMDITRITGLVYEANTASRRILGKNGFTLEGMMNHAVIKNGNIYNLCIYGKMRQAD